MKSAMIALALLVPLAACSSEPPACVNESFFYNDVPGCKEAIAKWQKNDPKAHAKWRAAEAKRSKQLQDAMWDSLTNPKK